MTETQSYTIDLLNILPKEVSCFIQAPNLNNSEILDLMLPTKFEYYKEIKLTESNKKKVIEKIVTENVEEDFQSMEIRYNGQLLFEGYDGMGYGIISKTFKLPVWFIDKYIMNDICSVSKEW
jgi:hypothetical protein